MRVKPETLLIATLAVFAFAGVAAAVLHNLELGAHPEVLVDPIDVPWATIEVTAPANGAEWLQAVRQQCTPDEVTATLRAQPAPATEEGAMHEAACLALAGQVDEARRVIEGLPQDLRFHAAGVVFNAGHPAADAGNELAAGPLMEVVVDYWPNHYMALYHAGASSFERGDYRKARGYLDRFLVEYTAQDGWTSSARSMLDQMPMIEGRPR